MNIDDRLTWRNALTFSITNLSGNVVEIRQLFDENYFLGVWSDASEGDSNERIVVKRAVLTLNAFATQPFVLNPTKVRFGPTSSFAITESTDSDLREQVAACFDKRAEVGIMPAMHPRVTSLTSTNTQFYTAQKSFNVTRFVKGALADYMKGEIGGTPSANAPKNCLCGACFTADNAGSVTVEATLQIDFSKTQTPQKRL